MKHELRHRLNAGLPAGFTVSGILRKYLNPAVPEVIVRAPVSCADVVSVMPSLYIETLWHIIDSAPGDVVIPTEVSCAEVVEILKRIK